MHGWYITAHDLPCETYGSEMLLFPDETKVWDVTVVMLDRVESRLQLRWA